MPSAWRCALCTMPAGPHCTRGRRRDICHECHDDLLRHGRDWCALGQHKVARAEMAKDKSRCKACDRQRSKRYHTAERRRAYVTRNRDRVNAHRRDYYAANRDRMCELRRASYERRRETALMQRRHYYQRVRERECERHRAAYWRDPERHRQRMRLCRVRRMLKILRGE